MVLWQRAWVLAALFIGVLLDAPCHAGPPFVTDDPEPVDLGHFELYLGGMGGKSTASGIGSYAAFPFCEFNYGLFPELQVHIIAPLAYNRVKDGGDAYYGYGDTELGIKYRFIKEREDVWWWPQVGIFPLLEVNTGNAHEGLGNGRAQFFMPVWIQKSWDKWLVYGGGGFFYNSARDSRSFWRFGVVVQRQITENFALGAEIYHETPSYVGLRGHTAFNIGPTYDINEHIHLLFSAGRDIDGPNQFATYAAIQFTW